MPEELTTNLLPQFYTRRDYFDFLDRWTVGAVDNLRTHMSSRALVKAYLLETSRTNGMRDAVEALSGARQGISQIDETMFRLRWPSEPGDWAVVEIEDQRYPVVYTALESNVAAKRVEQLVQNSPLLDKAWFAAPMFRRLWQLVLDAYPEHRFSQIVFEHESLFEAFSDDSQSFVVDVDADANDGDDPSASDDVAGLEVERLRARIQITERIGKLQRALSQMRKSYDPLESIVRLRVPAVRRGGHDVYFDGRFTNRSDSVASLRQTVSAVKAIYKSSTEEAEDAAWPQATSQGVGPQKVSLGLPLLIKFSEKLELATFGRWIASLKRKNNRFRLWGVPIDLGPGKVHIYAVDNHLWQPIDLEITRDHVYALLPQGTCGNTIHRLVANIQRFVDPKLETFIGSEPYEDFIGRASTGADQATAT